MGACCSSRRNRSPSLAALAEETEVVLRCLAGRVVDLPGGDEVRIAPDVGRPGQNFGYFKFPGPSRFAYVKFIGRAYALGSGRKFLLYLSRNFQVFGYEDGTGLHMLAKSLHDFLKFKGLSDRDLVVVDSVALTSQLRPLTLPIRSTLDVETLVAEEATTNYTSTENLLGQTQSSTHRPLGVPLSNVKTMGVPPTKPSSQRPRGKGGRPPARLKSIREETVSGMARAREECNSPSEHDRLTSEMTDCDSDSSVSSVFF
ncbi:ORF3 [Equid alphaherpesvirus 1]|uniref:ORF3 n=1 Tax=Equid alphaherpesvirus 1 TaxID=10326 RepID=A0A0A7D9W4_9ALPH|nr:ORF3 [Equid alphaherpesvirus 1]AII81416.1 ORF3 [Equid alphaherpesvirus 1]AII81496.1 ORF3 [Equid alphaherpesvirus 1]AII81576.1 ORF3 [Equid alphaherpesvirus 1]AII81656.1 ORF3 [Equid alphaherpesvirus 1]